jgi:2-polyprenyl-3-methyl-5-hydroxy-6-metoxy-1,4-benzoquinol methylase
MLRRRPKPRPKYVAIRSSDDPDMRLVAGSADDRVSGLGELLGTVEGASVFDVGCHDGTIAKSFAEHGAKLIHGIDFHRPSIGVAQASLRDTAAATEFAVCDLTGGPAAMRSAIPGLLASYDVVLYLGVHHHIARQMRKRDLSKLVDDLLGRAGSSFAFRTSTVHEDTLDAYVVAGGFDPWYSDSSATDAGVNPLHVYKRR